MASTVMELLLVCHAHGAIQTVPVVRIVMTHNRDVGHAIRSNQNGGVIECMYACNDMYFMIRMLFLLVVVVDLMVVLLLVRTWMSR